MMNKTQFLENSVKQLREISNVHNMYMDRANIMTEYLVNKTDVNRYQKSQFAIVLGVGGIGSWVAKILDTLPYFQTVVAIDRDVVEESNLNRTPFEHCHLQRSKVESLLEICSRSNLCSKILPFVGTSRDFLLRDDLDDWFKEQEESCNIYKRRWVIFDCRDNVFNDYNEFYSLKKEGRDITIVRAAYDKTSVTLHINPQDNTVLTIQEQIGYSVQPSFIIPSMMAANLAVLFSMQTIYFKENVRELTERHLTFDLLDLGELLLLGMEAKKELENEG